MSQMDKKDCENIGLILSEFRVGEELCEEFFKLDERIESYYKDFLELRGISEEVDDLAEELMIKYNGPRWALKKQHTLKKSYGDCLKEARETINNKGANPEGEKIKCPI